MELAGKVKEVALENDLDYVGIASADALQHEPEDHRPEDFLPGAKTVISLGIKIGSGVQLANKLAHRFPHLRHAIFPYLWQGFGLPSLHFVDRTSVLIMRLLEREGYLAVPTMCASTFDIRSTVTEFSNIHAAVAAGIGDLGWCDLVMTPDTGPRARFGAIITTADLEPDPMYDGPQLCDPDRCEKVVREAVTCSTVCPTKAIGPEEEEVIIGDRTFRVAKIDQWRCTWGSMGLTKEAGGLRDIPMPEDVGPTEIFDALKERDPSQSMELMVIGRGDYCGKCVIECPVGINEKIEEHLGKV